MTDEKYATVVKFVNRHLPALLDINENFHRPCHINCTNMFVKKGIPGWKECQDFCGTKTVDLMKRYLHTDDRDDLNQYMDNFNMINHLYVPCVWTRGSTSGGKKQCVEEYRQSLIEFFDKNGLPPLHKNTESKSIDSRDRTSIRNENYKYDEQVKFINLENGNKKIHPYYTMIATIDDKTHEPRMVNVATPILFVVDFDGTDDLACIVKKLQELHSITGENDTWAIIRSSIGKPSVTFDEKKSIHHYHAMNLTRRINLDSKEAQDLTNFLGGDKKYLTLSRKNRQYLLRFTPKLYNNFSNNKGKLFGHNRRIIESTIPKYIGLFYAVENDGPHIDPVLDIIFDDYINLIDLYNE